MVIERIASPQDLKRVNRHEIDILAQEIRDLLVAACSKNGGHLGPNLGVVELTLALHSVLSSPRDKIIWDVSHQSYVHKILTGRADQMMTVRTGGGLSGFSMRSESEHDAFGAGHASTSVSAALGMAMARDLRGSDETIVAVIGDGALTGGLAYEALNNAGQLKTNFIVILNDNEMSIAPNVGAIDRYLGTLRSKPLFDFARNKTKEMLGHVPFGKTAHRAFTTAEEAAIRFVTTEPKAAVIFEELGFRYVGLVDGHDYDTLVDVLRNVRKIRGPVLLHVKTVKGKGFEPAEQDKRTFHGVPAFELENGKIEFKSGGRPTFSQAFADALTQIADHDRRVVAITAAMPDGTQLRRFAQKHPDRYFDVGIAEAHAVCFAAGAATAGLKPVCAIYSTFMQRAYDQVVHDVVIQKLPVVLCMDRAGVAGDDGPTHMGLYDIAFLRTLPHMTIMAPRIEDEMGPMLAHALSLDEPVAIRYPRGNSQGNHLEAPAPIVHGRAEVLHRGEGVAILALGNTCDIALDAYDLVANEGGAPPTVVNMRFVRPLDEALLLELAQTHRRFITLEEHALAGGFGSAVTEFASDRGLDVHIERVGVPHVLIQHAKQVDQRAGFGLSADHLAARIRAVEAASRA
ncbi:MAG TPA: 1-deoxy-D-xylulose-5-phosphate synthase [Candidatus Baltobacteraceae bacterium]